MLRRARIGPPERVALLAEGVDRNYQQDTSRSLAGVALLAEGVDRNWAAMNMMYSDYGRPPRGGRG